MTFGVKKMKTGKLIKELRIKKGMTQEELAERTELSARTIQRIENGEVDPRAYTLQMIAKALDVDYDLFVESESGEKIELQEDNNNIWLALIHLSGLFLLIFPSVLIWNKKKDKIREITAHYRDVMRFQLTGWFLFILPGLFLSLLGGKTFILAFGIILNGTFTVLNTIRVLTGKSYKYLLMIHFKDNDGKTKLTFK